METGLEVEHKEKFFRIADATPTRVMDTVWDPQLDADTEENFV